MNSFLMNKNLFNLFLLFKFTICLWCVSTVGFFPIFGTFFNTSSHRDHTFKCFNTFAHSWVQKCLHRMQMVLHVLSEACKHTKRLLQWFTFQMQINVHFYKNGKTTILIKHFITKIDLLKLIIPFEYISWATWGNTLISSLGISLS